MTLDATRLLAIRHGETAWNVDTRIQGHLDVGLNAHGRWQAQRVAASLAQRDTIDHIYTSDLSRAHDTAQAIAQATGAPVTLTPGLRERHFGLFQGKTFAEIEATWPHEAKRWKQRDPEWLPEGGESLVMVQARLQQVLDELAQRHAGEQIALVAHGGVMDVLYRMATGQSLHAPRTWALTNTAVNRLLWTPQGMSLVGWADVSHLDDIGRDETTV
jgi:probable phosphoglycerate mutase